VGRLFPIQFSIPSINSCAYSTVINNPYFWHKKLGHPNYNVLTHLMKHGYLGNKNSFSTELLDCSSCKLGKSKALLFPSHGSCASKCFEIIHIDVWGVSPIISHAQYKYFVTFIDDFSRFTWIYFLRSKADVFSTFQAFVVFVENQFSAHIKILRSDSGGEYMSKEFQEYLKNKGILSQRSCLYTPRQNGVTERKNRHLLDVVRTLLIDSSILTRFWVEALSTGVHLINRLPSQVLNFASPYSILFGIIPEYDSLHVFGCVCFVHLPFTERNKLSAQAARCAFLGYSNSLKGFVCYDANAHRIRIS
jgi:transposase InsO family protein